MKELILLAVLYVGVVCAFPLNLKSETDCRQPPKNIIEGDYLGDPQDYARDIACAREVLQTAAPKGFVTVFGSARLDAKHEQYQRAYQFAALWTKKHPTIPVMTGAGPGLMEAANKGAREAGGKSLGFATRFGQHGVEKPNAFMTDYLEFSDFALRESWMINPARAIVIGSGGVGTGWELFEAISKKQTGKIRAIPIVFMGSRSEWQAIQKWLDAMASAGTIHAKDKEIVTFAATAEEAVALAEAAL